MRVTYTNQQMMEATDLPARKIQFWTKEKVLVPTERTPSAFRFDWSEIEVARLLVELDKRQVRTAELVKAAEKFREVINLADTGFLANDAKLLDEAVYYIKGDGPALVFRPGGGGAGMRVQPKPKAPAASPILDLTAENQNLFWCYVAYRLAKDKQSPCAWIVWAENGSEPRIVPRLFQEKSTKALGVWGIYAEFGHKDRGSGIIVDLRVLAA